MHYWNYGTGGWIGPVLMLAITGIVVSGLVVTAVILLRRFANPPSHHDEALRVLNERFARGEIDKDEFEQRRAAILS